VLNFGNKKICRGQNLASTGHVKGLAVVSQLQAEQNCTVLAQL